MKEFNLVFIGMDTPKSFIECAFLEGGFRRGFRRRYAGHHGRIKTTKKKVIKMVRQFESKYPGASLPIKLKLFVSCCTIFEV